MRMHIQREQCLNPRSNPSLCNINVCHIHEQSWFVPVSIRYSKQKSKHRSWYFYLLWLPCDPPASWQPPSEHTNSIVLRISVVASPSCLFVCVALTLHPAPVVMLHLDTDATAAVIGVVATIVAATSNISRLTPCLGHMLIRYLRFVGSRIVASQLPLGFVRRYTSEGWSKRPLSSGVYWQNRDCNYRFLPRTWVILCLFRTTLLEILKDYRPTELTRVLDVRFIDVRKRMRRMVTFT